MTCLKAALRASLAVVVAITLAPGSPAATATAQKNPKPTTYPTVAEFSGSGIVSDGPLHHGVDGVSSYRVSGSGSTNGWAFDLAARRSTTPRTLIYDLTNPSDGAARGLVEVNDTHGQVYDLSTMTVGEIRYVRAAFHLTVNRVDYVLRFGQTSGDGSSALEVERLSESAFHVRTGAEGDLARYLQGNGPGAILLGIYHVPVDLVLTNQ